MTPHIVCVGDMATERRCTVDLNCHPAHFRRARDMQDLLRVARGYKPEAVVWVNMAAEHQLVRWMRERGHREISIVEARELLADKPR